MEHLLYSKVLFYAQSDYNMKTKTSQLFLSSSDPVGGIWTLNEEINYEVYVIMESKIKKI